MSRRFTALAAVATVCAMPAVARGETATPAASTASANPATRNDVELLLLGGYGAGATFEDDPTNRFGVALGARGGVTVAPSRLYFGGSLVRFLGNEGGGGQRYTMTLDGQLGYEFRLVDERFVVRPELGLGVAQLVTIQSDNAGYLLGFHAAPGVVAATTWRPFRAAAELRFDYVAGEWPTALTALLGLGLLL